MFKFIQIHLRGPICNCNEQNLAWGINLDKKGRTGLEVSCKTCEVKILIPSGEFKAGFDLDKEYPQGRAKPKEDAKILKLVSKTDESAPVV